MSASVMAVILGCSLVTIFEKCAPLWLLSRFKPGRKTEEWLGYVPAAVLAALAAPEIFLAKNPDNSYSLFISANNVFLAASVPALIAAYIKESFFGAVAAGMAAAALLRYLGF
ncbi:MAG: AzlD domain-containing protein [Synergistaceae bacterium]|jgi:branched-subunit amino acid transport protein|nr:AzlD domain-containing protein [Synergistaceae bacterium]